MSTYQERVKEFDLLLDSEASIDMKSLKKKCFRGIPEGRSRRSIAWRILLGEYFRDVLKTGIKETVENKLAFDPDFHTELTIKDEFKDLDSVIDEMILSNPETNSPVREDHPLNPNPNSSWQNFFKDNEVLLQIDKDVRRLCPDISFFSQASEYPNPVMAEKGFDRLHQRVTQAQLEVESSQRKGIGPSIMAAKPKKMDIEDYAPLSAGMEAHWEVVERILFLYAKLNPGQGKLFKPCLQIYIFKFVISLIIYFTYCSCLENAEADCFFCFTNLMSDIRDFFIKSLDDSPTGIRMMMLKLNSELESSDWEVFTRLDSQGIKMQFFAFRWISLMLSQEFPLPEVLTIWDALLTDDSRCDLLIAVCRSMLKQVRTQLLSNDFSSNVKLLQNYPSIDVRIILDDVSEKFK
ncbi:TBC1 domain family member 13 [Eurytemora carolleeae]|uniref:TBC1 domain family member 13 n=1 Tax=Eurytemora carolleeae TaxID=1294199 RepID=UPI000C76F94A|nr:TBC1 domain family member 13 [Eurytemora carolleeae]|eukprot:XP_023336219.1 TBC1 domain family member 13-like [Eurytemora affinis]